MDMKLFKKALGVGLLAAAAMTNSTAHAANAEVTVDVNLPTVLVMYHYDRIELFLDGADLADYFFAGTNVACNGGTGLCQNSGTLTQTDVALGSTTTVAGSLTDPGLTSNTVSTFTLEDVVGVRAFGCTSYDAFYSAGPLNSVAVTIGANTPITDIDGALCNFGLTTGSLEFLLDFEDIPDGSTQVSAVFDVTINGL